MDDEVFDGDFGDIPEETIEVKAMKQLLKVAKEVSSRCVIADDDNDELIEAFEAAINDAEWILFPEDDDPRSMGWVGDDGLP